MKRSFSSDEAVEHGHSIGWVLSIGHIGYWVLDIKLFNLTPRKIYIWFGVGKVCLGDQAFKRSCLSLLV
jgi:hypothetical protein